MPGAGHDPQELSEQALRDLRWLLLSPPPLASGRFSAEVQAFDPAQRELIEDWLESLQAAPDPLRQAMERHRAAPLRLGRYAERLLEFFLRSGPTHRLVAANLPLRKASGSKGQQATTLGEIDFLLEDASGRPWHWELAVKFFLCVAPGQQAQPEDFIGPDPTDTLAGKLRTLFERQLRRTPPSPWDERAWRPAAFTRGWMFYRFEQAARALRRAVPGPPERALAALERAGSIARGAFPRAAPRPLDVSGASRRRRHASCHGTSSPDEIRRLWLQAGPRPHTPRLVARMEPGAGIAWHEAQRYFVVPDSWP